MEIETTLVLKALVCGSCGVAFAIEESKLRDLMKTGKFFFCPNGHHIHYSDNEVTKLKKQLKKSEETKSWFQNRLAENQVELTSTNRRLAATKGVLTKTKKRIVNGCCPCCHRQFVNLHRHLTGQHPYYANEDKTK